MTKNSSGQKLSLKNNKMGQGIIVGIGLGMVMGVAMGDLAAGVALGVGIGTALGAGWSQQAKQDEHKE